MDKKKGRIIIINFACNTVQNQLNINYNNANQIVAYYTLTHLMGVSVKTAFLICLFL
jgi:hypothetical protein